jgi:hypothetical protein
MRFRPAILIGVLWAALLVATVAVAGRQLYAFVPLPEPVILSGGDIAFRLEGRTGERPAGRWVIRINDVWVEPEISPGRPRPAR